MTFVLTLAAFLGLFLTAECLRPRPDVEDYVGSGPSHSERVSTGLFTSRMVIVPDGEIWMPRRRPISLRSLRALSTCDYCDTTGSWSKKDRCTTCGAPRPA